MPRLILALALFCVAGHTMPSYDDVLIVVKQGDAESAAAAQYFKEQRQIPDENLVTLPLTGTIPTVTARDAFISGIRTHMTQYGLDGRINYIVLSSNFPRECKDTATSSYNAIFDSYLMWALSDTYPSTSYSDCIPLNNNPYYYIRTSNYEDRTAIKFTKAKYRYYSVSRLDGEGLAATKQLIDHSGHVAYDQYKKGINFLVDDNPSNWAVYGYQVERAELKERGINIIDWNPAVSGSVHNLHDLSFAYFNWVNGTSDPFISYRNISKHMRFNPGALVFAHRSYPARLFKRPLCGLSKCDVNARTVESFMKSDASDLLLRQMADVAYATENNSVWCALGQDILKMYSTANGRSANNFRGNGVAVYAPDGTLLDHFTTENTRGGLLSDAVYRVTYDAYNHKVWIGTFKGVCAYDLATGAWEQPAGLTSAAPAPVYQIYVDPTTAGQYLYVTFSAGATGCTPGISDYLCVLEYNVSTGAIKRYKFHGDAMYNASVTKTAPNTLWAVYWRLSTTQALVSKYSTDTAQLLSSVDLGNVDNVSYKPTATGSKFAYQVASAKVNGVDRVYVTIRNEATPFNGVLRIEDVSAGPQLTVWGHNVTAYGTDKRPAALAVSPLAPGTVYCIMTGQYDTDAASRIYRFGDAEPVAGTLMTIAGTSTAISGSINNTTFGPDGTTLYYTQSFSDPYHEPVVDFFPFGAAAGMGGYTHDYYSYGGWIDPYYYGNRDNLISAATSPDYARDADLYAASSRSTSEMPFSTSLHLMNGFYLAEARLGTLIGYPAGANGGHTGHMFVFDPKACPYAPRVDEEETLYEVADRRTLRARIFSPGFPSDWANLKSREGGFIASTVNANTVALTSAAGATVGLESVAYVEREVAGKFVCEVVVRAAADLAYGGTYRLTLACGVNGIKNNKGASLVNTRPDEFRDDIGLVYVVPPAQGALPLITRQPADQSVGAGQTATFRVSAVSAVPMTYQWRMNGLNISGATSATYVTAPTTAADNGKVLTVRVSNAYGSVTSATADLTVLDTPPAITAQPAPQIVELGEVATFGVSAVGSAPLAYQWFRNSVAIVGATGATYTTPPAVAADNGAVFTVVVSNGFGARTSSVAGRLGVVLPPSITTQPCSSAPVAVGSAVSFQVVASMVSPDEELSYQWRRNGVNISGANSRIYTHSPVTSDDDGAVFSVVVSNAAGSTTSTGATLTVFIPPTIVEQPVSQTVNEGQPATFSAVATGTGPLTYQWHRKYVSIEGATATSYTTPPVTAADDGAYFGVIVANAYSSAYSATATLTVNLRPTAITLSPLTGDGDLFSLDSVTGDLVAVDENQPPGTVVGILSTTDPDSGEPFTYSLVPGDGSDGNEFFTIVGDQVQTLISFDRETQNSYAIRIRTTDSGGAAFEQSFIVEINNLPDGQVVGRHIFYNQSAWDGNNAAANISDDTAIAPDKQALLPGQTATFVNYTSYSRGINGIMIDIAGLAGTPTVDDFGFKVGNNNDPTTWAQAPLPTSISVRTGAGVDGSDRITLIWPNWPDAGCIG
ncbi:MAG TPA: cadherin domain-containing protein, partial [Verrucomicrobiota bacterium]|nr:cadherin domain-containing protein [Verrucomicrobiota bacterium]